MGCDIHSYVERLHPTKGWVPVNPVPSGNSGPRYLPNGDYNYDRRIDWDDWGRWLKDSKSPVKALADTGRELVDIIPEKAESWSFGRNYEAFGELAGVRREELGPPIERRGVPEDISEQLFHEGFFVEVAVLDDLASRKRNGKTYYWGPYWHSSHWYSLSEMIQFCRDRFFKEKRIWQLRDEMKKVAKTYGLGSDGVRFVFWFDN
jgi:hypothetical protein